MRETEASYSSKCACTYVRVWSLIHVYVCMYISEGLWHDTRVHVLVQMSWAEAIHMEHMWGTEAWYTCTFGCKYVRVWGMNRHLQQEYQEFLIWRHFSWCGLRHSRLVLSLFLAPFHLKGTVARDFWPLVFSWIDLIWAPDSYPKKYFNSGSNSRRYSNLKAVPHGVIPYRTKGAPLIMDPNHGSYMPWVV